MKRAVPFYHVIPYEGGKDTIWMNLANHMDWSELLIKNYSQPYVKFILYKSEDLLKEPVIGKIIGIQGGTLREY